jgi:Fe-S-cluster containining protein
MAKRPDCRTCGLCCVSLQDQDSYCDVTVTDVTRLGTRWSKRNVLFWSSWDSLMMTINTGQRGGVGAIRTAWKAQRSGPMKGAEACACVALRGSLLYAVSCSVYRKRPEACRTAAIPGDRACLQVRQMFEEAGL